MIGLLSYIKMFFCSSQLKRKFLLSWKIIDLEKQTEVDGERGMVWLLKIKQKII